MKICLIIFITVVIKISQGKYLSRQFQKKDVQGRQKSIFLTKFDFGTNGGNIKIKSLLKQSLERDQRIYIIDIVIDDQLNSYLEHNCQQRNKYVYRQQQVDLHPNNRMDEKKINIPEQNQEHIYYLYLGVCQGQKGQLIKAQKERLVFQITLYNDGSHFGEDQKILTGYLILVGIWVVLMVKFALPIGKSIFNSKDQTKITVFTGLIVLGVSYFYRLLHLLIYYVNGQGIYFFDILYIILKSSCQFIIVTVLIAVGWGWSIVHLRHDQSYILAGVTAAIINIVGLIVSASAEQMADTHHKYDSTAGYILQILRGLILIIFIIGILRTASNSVGNIRKFIKKLGFVGGIYLSSWPLTVILAETLLPNYMHNEVITFLEQITHILAAAFLCQMFAHPESTYRKVSIKQEDNPLKMQNYKRK